MTDSSSKLFTLVEVSSHNSRGDCWIIIHSKVYDVTKFLEEHPGGEDVLLASTGKVATKDFEDIGHTDNAKALMNKYYLGDIDEATVPAKEINIPPKQPKYNQDRISTALIRLFRFLLHLFVLALALASAVRSYS
ncbi:cytochrome b5-like [Silene latifolia]|uniref:cytochrome b5-like n=1 Tax=Silene latifolia TaxID=37657 RepID=UPI003D780728